MHLVKWSLDSHALDICFNQRGNISTLNGSSLKLEGKFTYLGSSVSLTETDFDTRLAKAETAIDWLSVIFKSDITDKIKRSFFQAAVVSILLYGCTTWTLNKEKMLDGNYTRMQRAILNKSWKQHPTKKQLYGYLPLVTKTIKVRRTRHAGHCWRSRDELISDILLWTPSHGRAKAGRPARTYIQQLCADTGCNLEDRWTIEKGEGRGSGRSALAAWHDDDDGTAASFTTKVGSLVLSVKDELCFKYIYIYMYIYIYIYILSVIFKTKFTIYHSHIHTQ